MGFNIKPPNKQIALIMSWIYESGLTTTSGGNISIREQNGDIWITPAGIDKGKLSPNDIVCVKSDGTFEGRYQPSSELPFHQAIYEKRPDLNAIIHAHPPALVSFSIVRTIPDTNVIPQAQNICGKVGYAPYRLPGSKELGESIASEFENGYKTVIMENHGTVVGGVNLNKAFQRFETLEFCARTIIKSNEIGSYNRLSDKEIEKYDQFDNALPKIKETNYPSDERSIRSDICRFIKRACNKNLMISTYGTVSVRWRENNFLITPTDVNRKLLKPEEIVQVKNGRCEGGKNPSRAVKLHSSIYKEHQHIGCIITTQSPNATAFCVSGKKFDTHTIPESYVMLKDVPMLPFGSQISESKIVPNALSKDTPILLIENDSILVTGQTILETFDRLEVAEFSARSLINTVPLGEVVPIEDEEIQKLNDNF